MPHTYEGISSFLSSSPCIATDFIHLLLCISFSSPTSSPIPLWGLDIEFPSQTGNLPPPAPTTHHIAALTICPPLHGVEMLAPELGPARRTHKAANVKDAVQGHDPGTIPDHIFSAATTPAWGWAGTGSICTGQEVGSTGLLTLQPHLPFPAPPGVSSPTEVYSPLGGWFMSCTSFLVSLSSSSSGGWLRGTWAVRIRGLALPLAPDAVTQGDRAILPREFIGEHPSSGARGAPAGASVQVWTPSSFIS